MITFHFEGISICVYVVNTYFTEPDIVDSLNRLQFWVNIVQFIPMHVLIFVWSRAFQLIRFSHSEMYFLNIYWLANK